MKNTRYTGSFETNPFVKAMNAQMRRIDLVCKLLGPLFIALIDGISTETAIMVNFGMNVCSVVVEYYSIAKVRPQSLASGLESTLLTVRLRSTTKCQNCRKQRNSLICPETKNLLSKDSLCVAGALCAKAYDRL
jgi:hypothetical protein